MPYSRDSKYFFLYVDKSQKLISNGAFEVVDGNNPRILKLKYFPENKDYVIACVIYDIVYNRKNFYIAFNKEKI